MTLIMITTTIKNDNSGNDYPNIITLTTIMIAAAVMTIMTTMTNMTMLR